MIVSNSTPLIYLSKIDKFYLLRELFGKVLIPLSVKEEVVNAGRKFDHIDAIETEKAIKDKWLIVEKTKIIPELKDIGIHEGEAEAISLAYSRKLMVLLDQKHARIAARFMALKFRGTIYVLLRALEKDLIDLDIYLLSLEDLVEVGFRMNQKVYLRTVRMGREMAKKKL